MPREKSPTPAKKGRAAQVLQAYRLAKQRDPRLPWILLGVFVAAAVISFAFFHFTLGGWVFSTIFALLFGSLITMIVFGRLAQRTALQSIKGQPGAAASVLGMLRRGWQVEPMVAFNKQQDVVSRVVGPPGIVLIGEGNPNRLKHLLATERRRHERVVGEVTVHELVVGDGEGQVPLERLARRVTKYPKTLKPRDMTEVLAKLRAIDASRSTAPIPKGPVPTSARSAMRGMRGNLRGR